MNYYMIEDGKYVSADDMITGALYLYPSHLFGLTKSEFDKIVEYDVLNIMAFYYSEMNMQQKTVIADAMLREFEISDAGDVFLKIAVSRNRDDDDDDMAFFDQILFQENSIYIPLSCKLFEGLGDSRIEAAVYDSLFKVCTDIFKEGWVEENNSYAFYRIILNAAYFNALAYKLHLSDTFPKSMYGNYHQESFEDYVEFLYNKFLYNCDYAGWDKDVNLNYLEEMIFEAKEDTSYEEGLEEEYLSAVKIIDDIHREYSDQIEEKTGIDHIISKTDIHEYYCTDIHGFEVHFCEAINGRDEYIIVYQNNTRIIDLIDDEKAWASFQRAIYYDDTKQNTNNPSICIIYILDEDDENIPIQIIESNRIYARKYAFTEEEAISFINGISKTSGGELGEISPVQAWDKILREEHLTGCLTETYAAKKVESYLQGARFDAAYIYDDDYSAMTNSEIPQIKWVRSLDTEGFRNFCFNDKVMQFGQINLFYGANGSGKTSVLEAIEYALTAEVRRVKDFKVKLPTGQYPKLSVYDTESGIYTFTPEYAKQYSKEIERVWYGVPVGRTKTTLNANFNRFNAFDSEAAYKFIHESDNSADSFSSMFGNLLFGETVVDHEKKWMRFKKAFEDRYIELKNALDEAREKAGIYEKFLAQRDQTSRSDEIEKGIVNIGFIGVRRLPLPIRDRYTEVLNELKSVRKYVDLLSGYYEEDETLEDIHDEIADIKRQSILYSRQKRQKSDQINRLTEENSTNKQKTIEYQEKQTEIKNRLDRLNTEIRNWEIVQNVLNDKNSIKLATDLADELANLDRELYYIYKIEQRVSVVNFLELDNHEALPAYMRISYEEELELKKSEKLNLQIKYNNAKKAFGKREQQAIELRKIGKTLLTDSKCPLCGQEYNSVEELITIIDSAVIIDDGMDKMILELQELTEDINRLEKIIDRERLIERAKSELNTLKGDVPLVAAIGSDYKRLHTFILSKADKEKRRAEIVEQQTALTREGFSIGNINACKEYTNTSSMYQEYKKQRKGLYSEYLQGKLQSEQLQMALAESSVTGYEQQIQKNEKSEEVLRSEIHHLDSKIEGLEIDANREKEQALETIKSKFNIEDEIVFDNWNRQYHILFDKCELEVERLQSETMVDFERSELNKHRITIKQYTPMLERCEKAVKTFRKMPTLSSFVEQNIRSNIDQISRFFKRMHHSGEFERLDIDSEGIYAIRGLNNQKVRTYEMSTGQRSTIAMAVMFALHLAAPDAPQFLLLDEPLATMDDTQVLNVLDILKSLAEQNTQIFFTTANGIMIDLFKKCFKDTPFDYKEYEFIKRINRPSEIKESSINSTKTIEELTLDDLTLDFHQFAQIREILRRNQDKLVANEDWEDFSDDIVEPQHAMTNGSFSEPEEEMFYESLSTEQQSILNILVQDNPTDYPSFLAAFKPYPNYMTIMEQINEDAMDYYGETIINTDGNLPFIEEDYIDELLVQHNKYYSNNASVHLIEEQKYLKKELLKAEENLQQMEDQRSDLESTLRRTEEEHKDLLAEAIRRTEEAEEAHRQEVKNNQLLKEELRLTNEKNEQTEKELREELRKAEERHQASERQRMEEKRLREEEWRKAAEERRREEEWRKNEEKRRLDEEKRQAVEKAAEERRLAEEQEKEAEQQRIRYRQMNVCQYCGGSFTGLFNKKCKVCGKPKDYS